MSARPWPVAMQRSGCFGMTIDFHTSLRRFELRLAPAGGVLLPHRDACSKHGPMTMATARLLFHL
jgi:hypothetical protein